MIKYNLNTNSNYSSGCLNLQPGLEQCPPYLHDFKLYETEEFDNLS